MLMSPKLDGLVVRLDETSIWRLVSSVQVVGSS